MKSLFGGVDGFDVNIFVVVITAIAGPVTTDMACFGFGFFAGFRLVLVIFKEGSANSILSRLLSVSNFLHCNLVDSTLFGFLPEFFVVPKFPINYFFLPSIISVCLLED
jgi:hypothetical protein